MWRAPSPRFPRVNLVAVTISTALALIVGSGGPIPVENSSAASLKATSGAYVQYLADYERHDGAHLDGVTRQRYRGLEVLRLALKVNRSYSDIVQLTLRRGCGRSPREAIARSTSGPGTNSKIFIRLADVRSPRPSYAYCALQSGGTFRSDRSRARRSSSATRAVPSTIGTTNPTRDPTRISEIRVIGSDETDFVSLRGLPAGMTGDVQLGDGADIFTGAPKDPYHRDTVATQGRFKVSAESHIQFDRDVADPRISGDIIFGGESNDQLTGAAGNDVIHGGIGNDEIKLGPGNDAAFGGPNNDTIEGEGGDDTLDLTFVLSTLAFDVAGNDILNGGTGDDRVGYPTAGTPVTGTSNELRVALPPDDRGQSGTSVDTFTNVERYFLGTSDDSFHNILQRAVFVASGPGNDHIRVSGNPSNEYRDDVVCGPGNDQVQIDVPRRSNSSDGHDSDPTRWLRDSTLECESILLPGGEPE